MMDENVRAYIRQTYCLDKDHPVNVEWNGKYHDDFAFKITWKEEPNIDCTINEFKVRHTSCIVNDHDKIATPPTEPIPNYGDKMTLEEFMDYCKGGMFIDYDGWGDFATDKCCSDICVKPSTISDMIIPEWATHVIWYNK